MNTNIRALALQHSYNTLMTTRTPKSSSALKRYDGLTYLHPLQENNLQ